eukprot:TRINITY_DN7110_c0_g1_i12.p4 TRINITY_DN7110_c0_g1~~TRINITY_DN7110_c0_g1_i12.p4  ORF type:complete len:185 (-),score=-5.70 TRINITY_DN7110_c0_g1_i12:2144-2698(-)
MQPQTKVIVTKLASNSIVNLLKTKNQIRLDFQLLDNSHDHGSKYNYNQLTNQLHQVNYRFQLVKLPSTQNAITLSTIKSHSISHPSPHKFSHKHKKQQDSTVNFYYHYVKSFYVHDAKNEGFGVGLKYACIQIVTYHKQINIYLFCIIQEYRLESKVKENQLDETCGKKAQILCLQINNVYICV